MYFVVIETESGTIRDSRECADLEKALNELGHAALHLLESEIVKILYPEETVLLALRKA